MSYRYRYVFDRQDETKSLLITDDDLNRHGLDLSSIPPITLYIDSDEVRISSDEGVDTRYIFHVLPRTSLEVSSVILRDDFKTRIINDYRNYYQFLQNLRGEGDDSCSYFSFRVNTS